MKKSTILSTTDLTPIGSWEVEPATTAPYADGPKDTRVQLIEVIFPDGDTDLRSIWRDKQTGLICWDRGNIEEPGPMATTFDPGTRWRRVGVREPGLTGGSVALPELVKATKLADEARRRMVKASDARFALEPGSSRARVATANARHMRACEAYDRTRSELETLMRRALADGIDDRKE